MNSENIKLINRLLSQKSAITGNIQLADINMKNLIEQKLRTVSTPVAKTRATNRIEVLRPKPPSESSWDPTKQSYSESDNSFDPDIHDPTKYTLDEKTGKYKYALLED